MFDDIVGGLDSGFQRTHGVVFDIQRFSVHDGPGIRTLVFMKGCPLTCKWCCNPEGMNPYPEVRFISLRCVGADKCGAPCVEACPVGAIALSEGGQPSIDRRKCNNCGKCSDACYYRANIITGKIMSIEEVLAEAVKDRLFYDTSGGGVTIGGGEPLMQFEFVREFLNKCGEWFLHTAIETCGYTRWKYLVEISKSVDLIYYDIKHMDPMRHKALTGVSNDLILANARKILSSGNCEVIVRTEVVPGYNDSEENIEATARFVAESGGEMMELLPYHSLGSVKYSHMGRKYELQSVEPPTNEQMEVLRKRVMALGLKEVTEVF